MTFETKFLTLVTKTFFKFAWETAKLISSISFWKNWMWHLPNFKFILHCAYMHIHRFLQKFDLTFFNMNRRDCANSNNNFEQFKLTNNCFNNNNCSLLTQLNPIITHSTKWWQNDSLILHIQTAFYHLNVKLNDKERMFRVVVRMKERMVKRYIFLSRNVAGWQNFDIRKKANKMWEMKSIVIFLTSHISNI